MWLFLVGALAFILFAALNVYLAYRFTRDEVPPDTIAVTPDAYQMMRRLMVWVTSGAVVLVSLAFAGAVAAQWDTVLRYFNAVSFDQIEPIFNKDAGFYVFTLPLLQFVRGWLMGGVIVVLLVTGGLYLLVYGIRGDGLILPRRTKIHLAVLGAGIFLLLAAGHWLGRYELLYSTLGTVFGVGYANDNASLPALQLLTGVALVSGALLVAGAFFSGYRLMVGAVGLWIGLAILAGNVYPSIIQRIQVEPNELARETPYLDNNIRLTRQAYGLDRGPNRLEPQPHPAISAVDAETIAQNLGTIQNIRLWDEGPLLDIYNQIQVFRFYYTDFLDVTSDRYKVNGKLQQVMLSSREFSADLLREEAQTWVNRHLLYTHGYGAAMSPVTEVAADGRPDFLLQNVPLEQAEGAPAIERPEIYYGLNSLSFIIARGKTEEFNYSGREGPIRYDGQGGVVLSSFLRRLLYAWQFGDVNILISGEIEDESRIQYRRTVPERFSTLAPFLLPDQDPYVVIGDGRLFWIQDAYAVTNHYPYSTPWQEQFNYMRNSVKAVVDAYHGTIDYYIADPTDPLIQTYARIFPTLFKPMEAMRDSLKSHVRYPRDFFATQTQMLLQYHMQDPGVFYKKEDQWSLPIQSSFGRSAILEPYYIVASLPDQEKEEFLLIQPFTPADRPQLIAWMAARNDSPNYGELSLFEFPTGSQIDGPNQIEARIDNNAQISEQFTLWGQVGSEVSRGILLVIPVGDAILYAEPVFLKPEALDFPELRRIILADGQKVVMQPNLELAIRAMKGEIAAVAPVRGEEELVERPREGGALPDLPALGQQGLEALASSLEEAVRQLQQVLDQLREIAEGDEES